MTNYSAELAAKRLELLYEIDPSAAAMAMLVNPNDPSATSRSRRVRGRQRSGGNLGRVKASSEQRNGRAFAISFAAERPFGALIVSADPFFIGRRINLSRWRPPQDAGDVSFP